MAMGFNFEAGMSVMSGKLDGIQKALEGMTVPTGSVVRFHASLSGAGIVFLGGPAQGREWEVRRISIGEPYATVGGVTTGQFLLYEGGITNGQVTGSEIIRAAVNSGPVEFGFSRDEWNVMPPAGIVLYWKGGTGQVVVSGQAVETSLGEVSAS